MCPIWSTHLVPIIIIDVLLQILNRLELSVKMHHLNLFSFLIGSQIFFPLIYMLRFPRSGITGPKQLP